jgi:hypothetical protein
MFLLIAMAVSCVQPCQCVRVLYVSGDGGLVQIGIQKVRKRRFWSHFVS